MRYTTRIELPVKHGKAGNYVLSSAALHQMIKHLESCGNILSIEWENGNCIATIELLDTVSLEPKYSSWELFVKDVLNQNSGRN